MLLRGSACVAILCCVHSVVVQLQHGCALKRIATQFDVLPADMSCLAALVSTQCCRYAHGTPVVKHGKRMCMCLRCIPCYTTHEQLQSHHERQYL